ncbi:oligosaccharide flippase family protein [Pontixanthobacter sp. CEM42]|uniref:oligosaccharide flippase family protein n=1 Tax=Pontixanthobacter sp. CEM42 TaxID=2792077 RepID=UPI001ADF36F6|nr:oligosaccharide flippase family protein [Pontixanthobacter sp. CEM42]
MKSVISDLARKGRTLASGPVAKASIVSVAIKVTGLALSFAQAVIAARLLGVEGYGMVAVALSAAQIGATLALFGFGSLAVREIAGWLASKATHLLVPFARRAAALVLLLSAVGATIVIAIAGFWPEYRSVLLIGAAIIPVLAFIQLLRGIAQGFGDVAGAQWPGEIMRPLLLIGLIGLSLTFAPLEPSAFLILFAVAGFGGVIAAALLVRIHLITHSSAVVAHFAKPRWLGKAAPFFGLSLLAIVQSEFATLMLALLASPEQAGLYQPIARLTPIIALPASAAAMRYAPRISELWNSQQLPRLIGVTRVYTLATTGLTTLATLILAGLGTWILQIFGADFVSVAALLWIVGAGQIFNTACGPVGYLLTMTGHTRIATIAKATGVTIALSISALLIPYQGTAGAAIGVAAGLVVWNIISLGAVRRALGFDPSLLQFITGKKQRA